MQFPVPVRGCTLSHDGRVLMTTSTKGFWLRYKASWKNPMRDKWAHGEASDDEEGAVHHPFLPKVRTQSGAVQLAVLRFCTSG